MTDTAGNATVTREYAYDSLARPVTRRTARQGNTVNDSFACNSRSELTAATVSGRTYGYSYDNIGNRKTAREDAEEATAYTTGPLNQYTAIERGEESVFEPVHDADGNQTLIRTSTGIWQVAYDAENRPVRFVNESTNTVVECTYDYMGRRHTRKVSVNGTVSSYLRYMYRGYLQIAAIDAVSGVFRWFLFWDPTQPEATRPLAIRKDGTWYAYGWDLTKNITEIFGKAGYLRTVYTYTPYGEVAAEGDVTQPIQWSSEYSDEELGLVYYNYRHLNPHDGRWISRDPIMEQGGWNLFAFVNNNGIINIDYLGKKIIPKDTPIIVITIKRKTIKWKQLVRENVFKKLEEEEDAYGHWWVELGNESYGWWPAEGVDLLSTLTGVPGYLNGTLDAHAAGMASMTRDAHHGDTADYEFHPVLNTGIFFSTFMKYGKEKGKKCCDVTEEGIKSCIRKFASSYSGSWSYPWGQNCHSFQKEMMNMCCIKEP